MNKVVYNDCYGGFSLSREAILLARELSGNPEWGGAIIKGDKGEDGELCEHEYGYVEVARHDPVLVRVVEELGKKASGSVANLRIKEIKGSVYRIDEYDGAESVVTPDDVADEWVRINT